MTGRALRGWALAAAAAALLLLLGWLVARRWAPEPVAAWVAVEVGDEGLARVGQRESRPGEPVRLHAVLEAVTRGGGRIYFTEARRLEMPDGPVDPAALRRPDPEVESRVLWFTVEGARPYQEIETAAELETVGFREIFHPEWPRAWSIRADLGRVVGPDRLPEGERITAFGTQRYHVRIELFGGASQLTPRHRFRSWGAAEVAERGERFPGVACALPGPLGPASLVFGLPQIEPPPGAAEELLRALAERMRRQLAFSRLLVIRATLDRLGLRPAELAWEAVDLDGGVPWHAAGDLLRAGARWVLAFEDRGIPAVLDEGDLVLDFERGAAVRSLREIFTGEGLLERARLGVEAAAAAAPEGGE